MNISRRHYVPFFSKISNFKDLKKRASASDGTSKKECFLNKKTEFFGFVI